MPLKADDLLQPIPGSNPAGEDLRYEPVYNEIKEARREEDEGPQGDWQAERKVADWPLVIKLTTEALAKKSKDLQLAVWLSDGLLRREGFGGLRSGLELIYGLLDKFWDHLYPEIEEGDAEMRAAPLNWLGLKTDMAVRNVPLVSAGHGFIKYNESQMIIGYEASVGKDNNKKKERDKKIEAGGLSGEEWDKAYNGTEKPFLKQSVADLDACLKQLAAIDKLGDKFGDVAPSYSTLKKALEEVQRVAGVMLKTRLEVDPDPVEEVPVVEGEGAAAGATDGVLTAEPVNRDDAVSRVVAAARFLRKTEPGNPAAYLMLRGLRWGEVKSSGGRVEPRLLTAPTTALRSQLKTLLLDSKWTALLEACETAMSQPCGRGWLDLQRYAIVACSHLGKDYYAVEVALRAALRSYLAEVPQIAEVTMMDDTPTGNSETRQWIAAEIDGNAAPAGPHPEGAAAGKEEAETAEGLELARAGRTEDAIDMLTRQLDQERSLRGRFRRRTQLAAILVASEKYLIALPILQELATQIDAFKLEEWESGKMVAEPLALLYMVLHNIQGDVNAKKTLYLRICRLDPIQALKCPQ